MSERPNIHRAATSKAGLPPIHSSPTTLIHPTVSLSGTYPITLGPNVIVQLRTHLMSTCGSLSIGQDSIIGEKAALGQNTPTATSSDYESRGIEIGSNVLIEGRATVEAASIGAYTIIETGAKVGKGAVIGEHCKICAKVEIGEAEMIENDMVVYGNRWDERSIEKEGRGLGGIERARKGMMEGQRDTLRSLWTGK